MKYNVAVTLPLTLWVEVEADNEQEAQELAKEQAIATPYEDWGDDCSTITTEIVPD